MSSERRNTMKPNKKSKKAKDKAMATFKKTVECGVCDQMIGADAIVCPGCGTDTVNGRVKKLNEYANYYSGAFDVQAGMQDLLVDLMHKAEKDRVNFDALLRSARDCYDQEIDQEKWRNYTVSWNVNLCAKSPFHAAMKAKEIQQAKDSTATFFEVTDEDTKDEEIVEL
jgi:hypothetical protein